MASNDPSGPPAAVLTGRRRIPEPTALDHAMKYAAIAGVLILFGAFWYFMEVRYETLVRPAQIEHAAEVDPAFIAHSMPLSAIMEPPTGEENAADYYMEGSKPYDTRRAREEGFIAQDLNDISANSPVLDTFIQGSRQQACTFSEYFSLYEQPNDPMPPFHPFQVVASNLADRVEKRYARSFQEVLPEKKQAAVDEALEAASAIIILGRHLNQERLSVRQLLIGLELQILGAMKLQKVCHRIGDGGLATKVEDYRREAQRLRNAAEKKLRLLEPLNEDYADAAIRIALEDEDPAYRALAEIILRDNVAGFMNSQTVARMRAALKTIEERGRDTTLQGAPQS